MWRIHNLQNKLNLDLPPVLTPEQTAKRDLLRVKLRALYHRDQFAIHEKVLVWHDQLKLKYADARDYIMFHLISGSTCKGYNGHFDFPDADSVERFIETQYDAAFPAGEAVIALKPEQK